MEGVKIVAELLQQQRYQIDHLYATTEWLSQQVTSGLDISPVGDSKKSPPTHLRLPSGRQVKYTLVSTTELKRISQLTTPNQVLAVVDLPEGEADSPPPSLTQGWSLYLDGVQSPANLGAILRVADWFGFHQVFGGPGTADVYATKSIQASMGTFLRIDYREMDIERLLAGREDVPVFAADLEGEDVFHFSPPTAGLLVIGNEGRGVSPGTRGKVNGFLRIPRAPGRKAESLNAAVATGILCGLIAQGKK